MIAESLIENARWRSEFIRCPQALAKAQWIFKWKRSNQITPPTGKRSSRGVSIDIVKMITFACSKISFLENFIKLFDVGERELRYQRLYSWICKRSFFN